MSIFYTKDNEDRDDFESLGMIFSDSIKKEEEQERENRSMFTHWENEENKENN